MSKEEVRHEDARGSRQLWPGAVLVQAVQALAPDIQVPEEQAQETTTMTSRKLPPLPRVMVPHPHVRVDSRIHNGSPHVDGTRVPVRRLWAWHRAGVSIDTLIKRYPTMGPAKVLGALSFAYDNRDLIEADLAREMAAFQQSGSGALGIALREAARQADLPGVNGGEP